MDPQGDMLTIRQRIRSRLAMTPVACGWWLAVALVATSSLPVSPASLAHAAATSDASAAAPSSCTTKLPATALPTVEDVYRFGHATPDDPERDRAGVNDLIVIKVKALCLLVDQAKCLGSYAGRSCKPQDVALYIDGREIKGLVPESRDVETLQFHLDRSSKSDEQWADLLGGPQIGESFFVRPAAVSVGLQGDAPVATTVQGFKLVRIHTWRFWICAAILVLTIVAIWLFAQNSALLRYSDKLSTYSLARCQMAFWFVLIIASYSFIWLITGAMDIVTNTALVLIGIGAGTALGGAVIDRGKEQGAKTDSDKAIAEKGKLQNDIDDLTRRAAAPGVATADAAAFAKELANKKVDFDAATRREQELRAKLSVSQSQGFWIDILSDRDGVEFHRFQMVVWTVVLGVVFVHSVWARLAMPEFSATLLTLMGISSGTYLGFKIPEK